MSFQISDKTNRLNVSFRCDTFKTWNCLSVLDIVKKESIIKCLFLYGCLLNYHNFFIVMADSFFTISYAWVFHDLNVLYLKLKHTGFKVQGRLPFYVFLKTSIHERAISKKLWLITFNFNPLKLLCNNLFGKLLL